MLSLAGFSVYDPSGRPSALSPSIIGGLLRGQLRFEGVTITDSLDAPTGHNEVAAGVLAAEAGADILLYSDAAPGALSALERALARGGISRAAAEVSYRRIFTLKRRLSGS